MKEQPEKEKYIFWETDEFYFKKYSSIGNVSFLPLIHHSGQKEAISTDIELSKILL